MGEIKIMCTIEPKDRPSYNEWTKQFRFGSMYVESNSGCLTFGDVILYAKSQMKSKDKQTGSDNVWPEPTS